MVVNKSVKCKTCGAEMELFTGDRNFCTNGGIIFVVTFNKPVYFCENCGIMLDDDTKKMLNKMTQGWRKRN